MSPDKTMLAKQMMAVRTARSTHSSSANQVAIGHAAASTLKLNVAKSAWAFTDVNPNTMPSANTPPNTSAAVT